MAEAAGAAVAPAKLGLYSYWRSSCSHRVRIALNLKGLEYEYKAYLEDKYPEHPLLPQDLKMKALNLQIASIVCSGIQPLHNLTVLRFIEKKVGTGESIPWTQQQIDRGFAAAENLVKGCAGKYATGDEVRLLNYPTLARLHEEYMKHPAFQAALPDRQPDAPSST
uniref:GST N-terminal domain-containing protein n=1 Tax=Oryza rufipogon TaxID=4529 RepID=A0A0E0NGI2_ORYRU